MRERAHPGRITAQPAQFMGGRAPRYLVDLIGAGLPADMADAIVSSHHRSSQLRLAVAAYLS